MAQTKAAYIYITNSSFSNNYGHNGSGVYLFNSKLYDMHDMLGQLFTSLVIGQYTFESNVGDSVFGV